MRARRLIPTLSLALALAAPTGARAQNRLDVIWARQAPPATVITLDGILDEPQWAQAESKVVRYGVDNGIPGSGYQEEGGKLVKDTTYATVRFLVVGNQLYLGVTVRDSSVGGAQDFNRFDGLLMSIKNHTATGFPKPPSEYFYSWWADTCDHTPTAAGKQPVLRADIYGPRPNLCDPLSPSQLALFNGACHAQGISN